MKDIVSIGPSPLVKSACLLFVAADQKDKKLPLLTSDATATDHKNASEIGLPWGRASPQCLGCLDLPFP